jgi:hypothetical protein
VVLGPGYTGFVRLKFRNLRRDWIASLLSRTARNGQMLSEGMGCLRQSIHDLSKQRGNVPSWPCSGARGRRDERVAW